MRGAGDVVAKITPQQDNSAASSFLEQITRGWEALPEPAMIELRCLFPDRTPDISRYAPDAGGMAWLVEHAAAMNLTGLNTYVVVNPVKASAPIRRDGRTSGAFDGDIIAALHCWADADTAEAAENIRQFVGPRYSMHVLTGSKPFPRPHVYWRLDEPCFDLAAWTETQKAIAATLSTDRAVVNASRIMRLPGMVNWPTDKKAAKGYVAEIATFRDKYTEPRPPISFETMQRAFRPAVPLLSQLATPSGPPPSGGFQIDTGASYSGQSLDRAAVVSQIAAGSDWHLNMVRLVASYVAKGLEDAEIHALTQPLTLPGYTGDQTAREVQTAIDGARRKGWTPQPSYPDPAAIKPPQIATAPTAADPSFDAPPPKPMPIEWFDDIQPSLADDYLVKGVIGAGAMSVVYGPSNSGKTFWATDLSFHIAMGEPWRGRRVKQAAVLYIAAEGGRGVANRLTAIRSEMTMGQLDIPFAMRRGGMDLLHAEADIQAVVDMAGQVLAKAPGLPLLIVIDTLSRIMAGGDENNAADMTALIRNIDAIRETTGAHVMLVHHTGKDTARGARGHSSLRAATDTEIEVANDNGARAAMVTKQRDYQGGEVFAFTLKVVELGTDQDGDTVTSCVIEAVNDEDHAAKVKATKGLGANQKILLEAFDQLVSEQAAHGTARTNPSGPGFPEVGTHHVIPYDVLRGEAEGRMAGADTGKLFRQAWENLTAKRGVLKMADKLVWRTDRKKR